MYQGVSPGVRVLAQDEASCFIHHSAVWSFSLWAGTAFMITINTKRFISEEFCTQHPVFEEPVSEPQTVIRKRRQGCGRRGRGWGGGRPLRLVE